MSLRPAHVLKTLLLAGLLSGCDLHSSTEREVMAPKDLSSTHGGAFAPGGFDSLAEVTPVVFNEPDTASDAQTSQVDSSPTVGSSVSTATPSLPKASPKNNTVKPSADSTSTSQSSQQPSSKSELNQAEALNKEETGETTTEGVKDETTFRPPFAERTDLFSPPQTGSSAPSPIDQTSQAIEVPTVAVILKGFARVNDRRVLLQIEDNLATLVTGQEKNGIRVVSIDPPKVTLARDQQEWTLSLSSALPTQDKSNANQPEQ